jgi:hypothetical protein
MPPATHGGNRAAIARRLGCRPADLLDLSASLAPYGPPAPLRALLLDALLGRTGVAFSVMMAYQKQRFEAKPGNSGSSRENGFPAPPQPRKTART